MIFNHNYGHFLNKVVSLLGFNKNPNSSTITTKVVKYLLFCHNNDSYLVIFRQIVDICYFMAQTGSETGV